nr:hypothetical protein [Burkholderia ubonensis]
MVGRQGAVLAPAVSGLARRVDVKFVLRVFDTNGSVQTLRVDSDSPASASALARSRGLRVVSVSADARRQRRGAARTGSGCRARA